MSLGIAYSTYPNTKENQKGTKVGRFCHLHVHTEYSLLDGAIRLNDLIEASKAHEMEAVAITDHGNIFAAVDFFRIASSKGIKPILGCEMYVAPESRHIKQSQPGEPHSFHLVLLVMDEQGYKNLCRLITLSHKEGFYYNPRVDMELLRELNSGLIAMSACLKGKIPHLILQDRLKDAFSETEKLAQIFDKERFFLEVMANSMVEQQIVNNGLREISERLGIPLVATNDCHYLNKEDAEAHDVLLCIQTGNKLEDQNRLKFSTDDFYFKSEKVMKEQLPGFEDSVENTAFVQAKCNYEMKLGEYKFPAVSLPEGLTVDEILEKSAREGLENKLKSKGIADADQAEYWERLEYELKVIKEVGFAGYFLIVSDFIDYAKNKNIPVGPGRGSAAGSLVAYALGITTVDPIKYGLIFERFLNPHRISMPDIDIDFCINGRDEVIGYVSQKYGEDCVSQIITFGTMKARAVIRDVARCLGIENRVADRIAKLIPPRPKITLDEAISEEPELKRLWEQGDERIKKLIRISKSLEGLSRHPSTHASGVVIGDRPLVEYLPLYVGQKNEIMTHFPMEALEKIGLIKFDFLGVKTLTVIRKAVELIEKTRGIKLDLELLDLTDEATFDLCADGRTTGVFQLESMGMKRLLKRLKPKRFEDLIAILALYRPGPLGSNMVDEFIEGKNGKKEIDYIFPELKPVLEETYGVMLYQEQAMKIAQIVADYSMAEADELRKAIGKKKEDIMARQKQRFIEGAVRKGKDKAKAEHLFELISKFGGYGFNKSHSTAYAMVAFQTAYLKAHFPLEFMTALLSLDMGSRDKTIKNILESKTMGIQVLPPDINESYSDFTIVPFSENYSFSPKIRFGLGAVKNVGLKAVEAIIREREEHGPFIDLEDFLRRMSGQKITKRVTECLIEAGAFDFTGKSRAYLMSQLEKLTHNKSALKDMGRPTLFGALAIPRIKEDSTYSEWSKEETLKREKEAIGFYVTGHPLDEYEELRSFLSSTTVQDLIGLEEDQRLENQYLLCVITDIKVKKTKKGEKMAIIQIEDMTGSLETLVFPDVLKTYYENLTLEKPVVINLTVESNEEGIRATGNAIYTIEGYLNSASRALLLEIRLDSINDTFLNDLEKIIKIYRGDKNIIFKVTEDGQNTLLQAGEEFRIKINPVSIKEFRSINGIESVGVLV